jgi:uncharacterized protein YjaZ
MKINVFFLESNIFFSQEYKKKVEGIIRETAKEAVGDLNLKGNFLNFTVYPCNRKLSEGFAQAKDWIRISISNKIDKNYLRGMVCHEVHHIKTGHLYYSRQKTLLETLIIEGLAVSFEAVEYNNKFIKRWLPLLSKDGLKNKNFNYYEWFWGTGIFPRFLGYKLGKYIIDRVRKNYPELSIKDLTRKKPSHLLKLSGVNL